MILKATYGPRIALQCVHVSDHFILKATLSSAFCHLLDKKTKNKKNKTCPEELNSMFSSFMMIRW